MSNDVPSCFLPVRVGEECYLLVVREDQTEGSLDVVVVVMGDFGGTSPGILVVDNAESLLQLYCSRRFVGDVVESD